MLNIYIYLNSFLKTTVMLVIFISIFGCASSPRIPDQKKEFQCDPIADNALMEYDYVVGIKGHKDLLALDPQNGLALYHLGYAYGNIGDHQKEIDYYRNAIKNGFKNENIYFNLGMAYGEMKQNQNAINAFQTAIRLKPDNADSYFWLATTYHSIGDVQAAKSNFNKAIEIDPQYVDARLNLSLLHLELGENDAVLEQLHIILKTDPQNEMALELIDRLKRKIYP